MISYGFSYHLFFYPKYWLPHYLYILLQVQHNSRCMVMIHYTMYVFVIFMSRTILFVGTYYSNYSLGRRAGRRSGTVISLPVFSNITLLIWIGASLHAQLDFFWEIVPTIRNACHSLRTVHHCTRKVR